MKLKDLAILPKVRDSHSYLYVEHCRIEQDAKAIAIYDIEGKTSVPCANLSTLMIGPGSTITHSAIQTLADNGCLVMWSGEGAVRFYAMGLGETRGSRRLLRQAFLSSLPILRLRVIRRMYELRFNEKLPEDLTLQQIRGLEGVRVRTAYSQASAASGIEWKGRSYNKDNWAAGDPVNRALSCANSCLYGVCHAAIVSAGYSPALGFIHTGRMLSFVYDIADMYKADITIPLAFNIVRESEQDLESRVRHRLRDAFHETRFLSRIIPDIENILDVKTDDAEAEFDDVDFAPGGLWNGGDTSVSGGVNWADESSDETRTLLSANASPKRSDADLRSDKRAAEVTDLINAVNRKLETPDATQTLLSTETEQKQNSETEPPASDAGSNETSEQADLSSTKPEDVDIDSLPWDEGGQVF